ncbi:hypothetical protein BOTBODRAFT_27254 [Botryobasidium botryosum FD-172 SS1]|uniref:PXA domain-containing protein n=1 Tax=Botryobasidium botryosum (strain FD-172 SS1) TaxID=930990 RepID=A0A067N7W8_BOTB1|nr:hypothetical protein BOTBODRAFT_27254 [Botryobasidium botryosum FD-172 SS1]
MLSPRVAAVASPKSSTLARNSRTNGDSNVDSRALTAPLPPSLHTRTASGPSLARSAPSVRSGTSGRAPTSPQAALPSHPPALPAPLAHRLFFPHLPPSAPLPPILAPTSTSATSTREFDDFNAEIYDFLAFSVRAFVLPWWTPLSHGDRDLPAHIAHISTHLIRALDRRARAADLPALLLRDVPVLITQHFRDFRHARAKLSTAYLTGAPTSTVGESDSAGGLADVFHRLQPHVALGPDGSISPTYMRQVVEHIMRACLPPEDWASEPERAIVREIIVGPVLGNVLPKLAQPWFLHQIALTLLGRPREGSLPRPPLPTRKSRSALSLQTLIVLLLTTLQTFSTFCLAAIALFHHLRHLVATVPAHAPVPAIIRPSIELVSEVLDCRSRAAAGALVSSVQVGTGFMSPFLDRLLPHLLSTRALTAPVLTHMLRTAKNVLYPGGYPGPPPVDPTPEEQLILREQLEVRIMELFPRFLAPLLTGPTLAARQRTIDGALDPLSSRACNAHLVVLLLDRILLTVFPEMGVGGPPDGWWEPSQAQGQGQTPTDEKADGSGFEDGGVGVGGYEVASSNEGDPLGASVRSGRELG